MYFYFILLISKARQGQHANVHFKLQMFNLAILFLKMSMSIVSMLSIVRLFQSMIACSWQKRVFLNVNP